MSKRCVNCQTWIIWGVFCVDCVRAFGAGLAGGLATWLLNWVL